ncbi:MAG: hypothetical protein KDK03_07475 [Rhodobacteraceae bacterium]|uniref:hypothetical protein n=1 Tax=Amaricoccus sp. B4 TaxID=3368557 RepID=UPI000DABEBF1|nr:hypothetical protein [Paracoccaceae bacterium]
MKTIARSLALAAVLAAGTASIAGAETLGQKLASGKISEAAFTQLIAHTGLTPAEASGKTVNEVLHIRADND